MHLFIIGANGRTGKHAIADALEHQHTITALVRDLSSMEEWREDRRVSLVRGSPLNLEDIRKALEVKPVDAILVTLNATRESDSPFAKPVAPPFLIRDCLRNVTSAISTQQIQSPILVMSAFGIGSSFAQLPWLMKLFFRHTNMKVQMMDHEATDQEIQESGSEYTLVRPAVLKEGRILEVKEHGETGEGLGLFSGITRASVARFMVEEAARGRWRRKAVVITN